MALLTAPRFLSLPTTLTLTLTPTPASTLALLRTPPPRFYPSCSLSLSSTANTNGAETSDSNGGAAVLWFKHDLRLDDHPGLVAAAKHHPVVVPVYVFDRRILSRLSHELLELLLLAVDDLRRLLKKQGANLMIKFGHVEDILQGLVKEVKATNIFVEEEVEYDLCSLIDAVKETLAADTFLERKPKVTSWRTPFYDFEELDDLSVVYKDLKKPRIDDISLLGTPALPSCDLELDWGNLPTMDDIGKFMDSHSNKGKEKWFSIKNASAEAVFREDHMKLIESRNPVVGEMRLSKSGSNSQNPNQTQRRRAKSSAFCTSKGNIVAGGTEAVLDALAAYLRYLEGTARDDWQEVHRRLQETEVRNGASFGALFGSALQLGIISRRRVYYEAIKYEKERNAGFLSPFGYSTATVAAAIDTVCSMEWYWLLGIKSQLQKEEPYTNRLWRWKGHLIQYTVVGSEGPAVLLVHGFGAFYEHYRDNLHDIADHGNRVWGVTLLGFGKSEKPNIIYSELMWAELLRDFIIEVVGEPAHLVGNSIGGYFISIVGGLWPSLVKSIILLNSAGDVVPRYSSLLFSKERQISGAAWLGARALLQYLRLSTGSLVKNCYPTRPERADDWLINEMLRASYDPGSAEVVESVFSFNLSIPLNHLFSRLKDKVLIIQGMKDPIADSTSKLAMLREHCTGLEIKEIDAGHCPHDERPEIVNPNICEWIVRIENGIRSDSLGSSLSLPYKLQS